MSTPVQVSATRLCDGPLIMPGMDSSIGANIQGPSLIRVPSWVEAPLGAYYLYFADHKGASIRLAYADDLTGPWRIHAAGSLQLVESHYLTAAPEANEEDLKKFLAMLGGAKFSHDLMHEVTAPHIASPDVHVDEARRQIVMYYHGLEAVGFQPSRVATSADGIAFQARPEIIARRSYLRAFQHQGYTYGLTMPGQLYRSRDGLTPFEEGPRLFDDKMRHSAVLKRGDTLYVFWSQVGDVPESILVSTIDIAGDWSGWKESAPEVVLRPERAWEGADAPLVPSQRSTAYGHVNQLRDPAIFEEDGRVYLLYAVAGESGIAIAELRIQ